MQTTHQRAAVYILACWWLSIYHTDSLLRTNSHRVREIPAFFYWTLFFTRCRNRIFKLFIFSAGFKLEYSAFQQMFFVLHISYISLLGLCSDSLVFISANSICFISNDILLRIYQEYRELCCYSRIFSSVLLFTASVRDIQSHKLE